MTGDTKGAADVHDEDPLQDDGHESGVKDGFDDEAKKKKVMTRLLTGRLDKLVAKKDDACALPLFLPFLRSKCICLQWKRTIKRLHGVTQQENLGHLLQNDTPPDEL